MYNELFYFSIFIYFVFGACLGSFSNVVILRLPQNKSVIKPPSHCPNCKTAIRWYDNIPLFSWLFLRGHCRNCKVAISWRYFFVELLMAALFVAVFLRFHDENVINWQIFEMLLFVFGLVTVSMIDFDHMILPDVFTLSGILIGLFGSLLSHERSFWDSFAGVLFGGGFFWSIAYLYYVWRKDEGIGGGDIKLAAWIGAILGWQSIPFVILSSSVIGSLVGLTLAIKTKGGLKLKIPYGPYLALGAIIYLFSGTYKSWYVLQFFPWLE